MKYSEHLWPICSKPVASRICDFWKRKTSSL